MRLTAIDWAIVAAYFMISTGIGFYFTKRGGESLTEYFLSGRDVPWWLAGASMVATTFAADTPLVVTGLVVANGVAGNWLWWDLLLSGMLTVFFFARLWRRAGVMTDVEFAEIRYSGKPAAVLRGFRALYLAIPINLLVLGWVTRAMIKILTISLGVNPYAAVGICFLVTMFYAVAAGLWAVLWTDLVQFVIKMTAVIVLAVFSVRAVGGMAALKAGVSAHFGSEKAALSVLPVSMHDGHLCRLSVDAAHRAWRVLLRAMVGRVVSGRRARRRRLRRPAHLLGANRARRGARHALLPGRALRASPVAVDHHRARDDHPLSRLSRTRSPATSTHSSICCPRRGAASCSPASLLRTCRPSGRSSTGAHRISSTTSTSAFCERTKVRSTT